MKQFRADLERAIDSAQERGLQSNDLDMVASERLSEYTTARFAKISDHVIKIFVVVGSLLYAGGIQGYRAWLISIERPVGDANWYDWVTGLCLLAAAGHFYDVTKIIRALRGEKK